VIAEGVEGGRWNGVNCVLADQFFDIDYVAVFLVFRAGAGPQQALRLRALRGKGFPATGSADFLILAIGEFGVGDGYFALQAREKTTLRWVGRRFQFFVERAVNEGVDSADEEAGNAGDFADVFSFCGAGLKACYERFCDLFIGRLRKEQRDIDIDAVFNEEL